jgi:hypothetical protein
MMLYEVVDNGGMRGAVDHAASLHSIGGGCLHCRIGVGSGDQASEAVLGALGKEPGYGSARENSNEKRERALAWLVGEGVRTLYGTGAESASIPVRLHLVRLAEAAEVDLWLIATRPSKHRTWRRVRADWGFQGVAPSTFLAIQPARPPERRPAAPFPTPPLEGYTRFRLAARSDLSRQEFARLDAAWRGVYAAVRAWLAEHPDPVADEEAAAAFLRSLIFACESHHEIVVAIRAAQAATLATGYYELLVDSVRFREYGRLAHRGDLEAGGADLLRRYANPNNAAAGVIRAITQATVEDLRELSIGDVTADGSRISVAGHWHDIPLNCRGILRALLVERALNPAGSEQPLLAASDNTGQFHRPEVRGISVWLRNVTLDTGLTLVSHFDRRQRAHAETWQSRYGLVFKRLI